MNQNPTQQKSCSRAFDLQTKSEYVFFHRLANDSGPADHCIEALRESLTCSVDVSVVPYRWHPDTKIAEPDIRSMHMCRNFTKIRDWAFDRFIPMTSKREHVEDGVVVDYSDIGSDPEAVLTEKLADPQDWNKTVYDL